MFVCSSDIWLNSSCFFFFVQFWIIPYFFVISDFLHFSRFFSFLLSTSVFFCFILFFQFLLFFSVPFCFVVLSIVFFIFFRVFRFNFDSSYFFYLLQLFFRFMLCSVLYCVTPFCSVFPGFLINSSVLPRFFASVLRKEIKIQRNDAKRHYHFLWLSHQNTYGFSIIYRLIQRF